MWSSITICHSITKQASQWPKKTQPMPQMQPNAPKADGVSEALGSATYEIIRQRLATQGESLRERMAMLDSRRAEVFGSIESKLLQADRIVTEHNCTPRDMIQLGDDRFLFAFNVRFGLKCPTTIKAGR